MAHSRMARKHRAAPKSPIYCIYRSISDVRLIRSCPACCIRPLISASAGGHLKMVELLIERGADHSYEVQLAPYVGWTALMFAVQNHHIDVVKALIGAPQTGVSRVVLTP